MTRRIEITFEQIIVALDAAGGYKAGAAARLGISPATLRRKMKAEGIRQYIWMPNIKRRIVTMVEADILIDGFTFHHGRSQRRILIEADRALGINEPRRLSDRELKRLRAGWRGRPRYEWYRPKS